MECYTTQDVVHLYTGNYLDEKDGKDAATYGTFSGLCLETQGFPNNVNCIHFPSHILKPGEEYHEKSLYRIYWKNSLD